MPSYSQSVSFTAIPIVKSDSQDIPGGPVRWVDVIAAGDVAFLDARGSTVTLTGLPAGYSIKCVIKRVLSAGTTASLIGYP